MTTSLSFFRVLYFCSWFVFFFFMKNQKSDIKRLTKTALGQIQFCQTVQLKTTQVKFSSTSLTEVPNNTNKCNSINLSKEKFVAFFVIYGVERVSSCNIRSIFLSYSVSRKTIHVNFHIRTYWSVSQKLR